jgi:hypothetical protein
MRKNILIICCFLGSTFSFFACKKKPVQQPLQKGIYVSGGLLQNSKGIACYWQNDSLVKLTDGSTSAEATCIKNMSNDLFIGGSITNTANLKTPVLWKNGVKQDLPFDGINARVQDIAISGQDIYAIGSQLPTPGTSQICLWKNGVLSKITDGLDQVYATAIAVEGNDVYITVSTQSNAISYGLVYKNGVLLYSVPNATFINLFVTNGKVFTAGYINLNGKTRATYWVDNTPYYLGNALNNTSLQDIAVTNGNIYACSQEIIGNASATIWHTGVVSKVLSNSANYSFPTAIAAIGTDTYISGTEIINGLSKPFYWKNTTPKELPIVAGFIAITSDILVIQ